MRGRERKGMKKGRIKVANRDPCYRRYVRRRKSRRKRNEGARKETMEMKETKRKRE